MDAPTKAAHAARFADDKKAEQIVALDLDGICTFTDAFMICTGATRLQLRAIAHGIIEGLGALGVPKPVLDGERNATWMVLDYGDVIVHIMSHDAREYYQLESLWGDGREVDWPAVSAEAEARSG
jgi:ribosome-associated protein